MMRKSLALVLALAAALVFAGAASAQPPKKGPDGKGKKGGGKGSITVDVIASHILSFDKTNSGKVSRDDLPERMQNLVDQGDINKDGFLDKTEILSLAAKLSSQGNDAFGAPINGFGKGKGKKGPKGGGGDPFGPGKGGKGGKGPGGGGGDFDPFGGPGGGKGPGGKGGKGKGGFGGGGFGFGGFGPDGRGLDVPAPSAIASGVGNLFGPAVGGLEANRTAPVAPVSRGLADIFGPAASDRQVDGRGAPGGGTNQPGIRSRFGGFFGNVSAPGGGGGGFRSGGGGDCDGGPR